MRMLLSRLLFSIVLGVATTVVVVWGCGRWVRVWQADLVTQGVTASTGYAWFLGIYQCPGARMVDGAAVWDVELYRRGRYATDGWLLAPELYAEFPSFVHDPDPVEPFDHRYVVDERGWPRLALRIEQVYGGEIALGDVRRPVSFTPSATNGLPRVYSSAQVIADRDAPSPKLSVLWLGALTNSAVFTGAWFLVLCVVAPVGRAIGGSGITARLALSLVLGLATTVAVAWRCALTVQARTGTTWIDTYRTGTVEKQRFLYVEHAFTPGAYRFRSQQYPFGAGLHETPRVGMPQAQVEVPDHIVVSVIDLLGWPFPAMRSSYDGAVQRSTGLGRVQNVQSGWNLKPNRTLTPDPFDNVNILPLAPLWGGFVLCTLFYAVGWVALFTLAGIPRWLQQIQRALAGACIWCGYDLRMAADGRCPECGARLR